MVQHTAQHALSRALADAARADTVSARLGATSCTIDVGAARARRRRSPSRRGSRERRRHERRRRCSRRFLRRRSSRSSISASSRTPRSPRPACASSSIEGFDVTPCGGTHCTRTGQIGQIRIVATEKYKGMLRITFHAGRRALADARTRHDVLATLAADLTCGPLDVPAAIAKLRAETKALRDKLEAARTRARRARRATACAMRSPHRPARTSCRSCGRSTTSPGSARSPASSPRIRASSRSWRARQRRGQRRGGASSCSAAPRRSSIAAPS